MKTKEFSKLILALTSIFILFFFLMLTRVGAMSEVEIILSDSSPEAEGVEYRFQLTTGVALNEEERIYINFPNVYNTPVVVSEDIICPENMTGSVQGRIVSCRVNPGETYPATSTEIIVYNVVNPVKEKPEGIADIYFFTIESDGDERAYIAVAIIEAIRIRGAINPILSFEVEGVGVGENLHNNLTNVTTTATSITFEDMLPNTSILGAQDLFVRTNAGYGFTVNIFQIQEPQVEVEERTYKIHCFTNGDCRDYENSTTWVSPLGILGAPETYGHFGITSEDSSLGNDCDQNYYGFGEGGRWAGLEVAFPTEVMRNCQPADGQTQHEGWTRVGFRVEVTVLQPAGEYETIFTYVVTPVF